MLLDGLVEGVAIGMGGVRSKHGMGPQAGDPQHPNLFEYVWMLVGLPPKHCKSCYFLQAWSWWVTFCGQCELKNIQLAAILETSGTLFLEEAERAGCLEKK